MNTNNTPSVLARKAQLLDRAVPDDYRREWTERVARVPEEGAASGLSVILFRLGQEWLALPTAVFQEAVEGYTIRSVPHQPALLLGLVNVRGELLLCLDMARVLGSAIALGAEPQARRQLLVLNWPGNRIAFPVDEVAGVHRYHPSDLAEAPATVAHASGSLTLGVLHLGDRSVGCLNDATLLARSSRSFA